MTIKVKFFASLREQVGQSALDLNERATTVAEVWSQATNDMAMQENTLMAVNMDYVDAAHSVSSGDEVAFFPPVTGG